MSNVLFVGNLAYDVTAPELGEMFHAKAPVEEVRIVAKERIPQGFAFVTMRDEDAAERIIELFNDKEVHGRKLNIKFSREQRNTRPPRNREFRGPSNRSFAPQDGEPLSKTRVHVNNLPTDATEEEIRGVFSGYEVKEVVIVRDPAGTSRGFGFVEFAKEEDQSKLVSASPKLELKGQTLTVRPARERTQKQVYIPQKKD